MVGLFLYLRAAPDIGGRATVLLVGLLGLLSLLTAAGALAAAPPAPAAAALTWALEAPLLAAAAVWIDRPRRPVAPPAR